jgi:hypothetical protein
MLSFKKFLKEIFDIPTEEVSPHHPDYKFVPAQTAPWHHDVHKYDGIIRDDAGNAKYILNFMAKTLPTEVSKIDSPRVSEIGFTVNHLHDRDPNEPIPPHHALAIGNKIYEYFHHHMMTVKPKKIVYDTHDKTRDSIYRTMANRYGITASNLYLGRLTRPAQRRPPETPESTSP